MPSHPALPALPVHPSSSYVSTVFTMAAEHGEIDFCTLGMFIIGIQILHDFQVCDFPLRITYAYQTRSNLLLQNSQSKIYSAELVRTLH